MCKILGVTPPLFEIVDLHASVDGHEILHGVDLRVSEGELCALMGPNGSGKSTLANVLMGNGAYEITAGRVLYRGEDITAAGPDARGRLGIFLGFQYPQEIPGVKMLNFMQTAMSRRRGVDLSLLEIRIEMMEKMDSLGMDRGFMDRHLNEGFSGGEKKRNEILQMALLEPDLAILDETDSGLDIDALRIVSEGIMAIKARRPSMGAIVITHYKRMLDHLRPDTVHVLVDGRIVESGTADLADRVDAHGFESYRDVTSVPR